MTQLTSKSDIVRSALRSEAMKVATDDNIDHGHARLEDCLEANILRFKDGFVLCPIIWSGGSCEECMEQFERREEQDGTA